ncbi:MAG TPA: hypothetical protein VG796_23605 [Verrucomicrobiales bacterium]|nr:hypothetical protein [Verrucomicrobiales bacterium]
MLSFFKRLFKRTPAPAPAPRFTIPSAAPAASAPAAAKSPPAKTAPVPASKAKEEWEKNASRGMDRRASPEELCGITPDMTRDEVAAQLAMLYRRHNRAASSLEAHLREEAEIMLDMVAAMRQKYLR